MNNRMVQQLKNSFLVHALLITVSILVCYYGLWRAYFMSDDYWMLGWVRFQPSLVEAIQAQFGYGVRFLLDAVLWTRVRLFDLDAAPYYWSSLAQHVIAALVVYGLAAFLTNRRSLAFLAALLFATTFAHYTVITWITGSEYSFAAILYLSTLLQFGLYLRRRRWYWYAGALITFILLMIFLEMFLSLPLVLVAYHLTLGREDKPIGALGWSEARLHLPFWLLTGVYLVLQFSFVQAGSSEAVVAQVEYGPGLHVVGNLRYLAHLVIPNVHYAVLNDFVGPTGVGIIRWGTLVTAIVGHSLAIFGLWRGTPLVRFLILFIYLTFSPYTLWEGRFAGAIRYMYLPSVGFSILAALAIGKVAAYFDTKRALRIAVPAMVILLLAVNLVIVQTWVQRHVENSHFRRAFVSDLLTRYNDVEPGTYIYIEVPAIKFVDLREACTLVFEQEVTCHIFVSGSEKAKDVATVDSSAPVFWLKATAEGVQQVFPVARSEE